MTNLVTLGYGTKFITTMGYGGLTAIIPFILSRRIVRLGIQRIQSLTGEL
uniref:Uncharacterized protein n=1 Tax=Nitrosopumivirus cobalaminus TaxID=3158414 RepID=A0AAU7N464_9VIRU